MVFFSSRHIVSRSQSSRTRRGGDKERTQRHHNNSVKLLPRSKRSIGNYIKISNTATMQLADAAKVIAIDAGPQAYFIYHEWMGKNC